MTYSWDLVRNRVRDFRTALQMTYPIQVLATVKDFVIDGDSLYFLSNHRISTNVCPSRYLKLYRVHLGQFKSNVAPSPSQESNYIDMIASLPLLQWKAVFSDYSNIGNSTDQIHIPGMTAFEKSKENIMFTFNNRIYIGTLDTVPTLIPFRAATRPLLMPRSESPSSPQISPIDTPNLEQTTYIKDKEGRADPKLGGYQHIAFIRNRDIWVTDFDGYDTQLTFCSENELDPTLSCGVAEYMIQEEFHRFTGYYWGENDDDDGLERILYLETSEQKVEVISVAKSNLSTMPESIRYPRAGKANAASKIKIVEFKIASQGQPKTIVQKELFGLNALECQFPWMEYITRFGWVPNTKNVWVQLLSRDQKRMALVKLHYSQFTQQGEEEKEDVHGLTEIIWEETSEHWINITDVYHFIKSETNEDYINLIWSSEKSTGYRHLFKVTKYTKESESTFIALTSGEWCCVDRPIYIDELRKLVYFSAKKDTPLETHLYVLDYCSKLPPIRRLTQPGFSHTVTITSSDYIVDSFSSLHHPPVTVVNRLNYDEDIPTLQPCALLLSVPKLDKPDNALDIIPNGEIFDFKTSDGTVLYGCLYKPRDYQPGQSYPTLLHIYGGPKTQLVMNDFKFPRLVRYLMSVYFGFAVVIIDSRGSNDRGIEFESYIKQKLGTVELKDQMRGLEHVVEHKIGATAKEDGTMVSVVDMSRLAITGWSYGGYLSLMALAQYPEVFKMAIAGAPVTRWELYDAAYTERYMGLPSENSEAYQKSSVLYYVDGFPENENRLLIAHGLIDENVHFLNTESLVSELVKRKKPHYLQVYPTEKHGLRHASVNEHFETLMFYWLVNYL